MSTETEDDGALLDEIGMIDRLSKEEITALKRAEAERLRAEFERERERSGLAAYEREVADDDDLADDDVADEYDVEDDDDDSDFPEEVQEELDKLVEKFHARQKRLIHRVPGAWVTGALAGILSPKMIDNIVRPTVDDMVLEYIEALSSSMSAWRLRVIVLRGYWSIVRALGGGLLAAVAKRIFEAWRGA